MPTRGLPTQPSAWPNGRGRKQRAVVETVKKRKRRTPPSAPCADCGTAVPRPRTVCPACHTPLDFDARKRRDRPRKKREEKEED